MICRAVSMALALLSAWLLSGADSRAAEIFYLDRDPFTNQYTGPVGPLVVSGEIVPGDYALLLAKIAGDSKRFLSQNKIVLGSSEGDAAEAMKIADLLRSMYTVVSVGPLTGRCAGACFLIYAAAAERGTDGENLLGVSRPGLAGSEWTSLPTAQAALLDEAMQEPARAFLTENGVPPDLIEEVFKRPSTDVYWLTEPQEAELGPRAPAFAKFLADKCGWTPDMERAVYAGARPLDDLKTLAECRLRLTQPQALKALTQALKDAVQSNTTRGK
jgi:hypothetical protein